MVAVSSWCMLDVIASSTVFLLFPWLSETSFGNNQMLSRNLAIVVGWNRVIPFSRLCTIRPCLCVGCCWIRILSDYYSSKLISNNLAQQVNFWFDGKAANCVFWIGGEQSVQKCRVTITVQPPYVFAAISVLKKKDWPIRWTLHR